MDFLPTAFSENIITSPSCLLSCCCLHWLLHHIRCITLSTTSTALPFPGGAYLRFQGVATPTSPTMYFVWSAACTVVEIDVLTGEVEVRIWLSTASFTADRLFAHCLLTVQLSLQHCSSRTVVYLSPSLSSPYCPFFLAYGFISRERVIVMIYRC